jgi:hypothetical protein
MTDPVDVHITTNKKLAAQRQIDAAIDHLHKMELECAISLAAAAEGMLPDTEKPYIFAYLRQHSAFKNKDIDFNETINWLKHSTGEGTTAIYELEAAIIIVRAMSKFGAIYDGGPEEWHEFLVWGAVKGFGQSCRRIWTVSMAGSARRVGVEWVVFRERGRVARRGADPTENPHDRQQALAHPRARPHLLRPPRRRHHALGKADSIIPMNHWHVPAEASACGVA